MQVGIDATKEHIDAVINTVFHAHSVRTHYIRT